VVSLVPSFVTLAGMGCGFFALLVVREGNVELALWLVFGAALCDIADGKLARALGAQSPFGAQLDSFADAISFGVAPALILYQTSLASLGWPFAFVAFFYTAMAVVRLIRFNLDSSERRPNAFRGFSTPMAALYVVSYVVMRDLLPRWLGPLYAIGLGWLMVSSVPSPAFKGGGLSAGYLVVGLASTIVLLAYPGYLTFGWWNAFLLFALVLGIRASGETRTEGENS
jgi:CDP-diacylglycerol--serine O-phosphatidyltransferase